MKIKNFITSMITILVMGSLFCSINQQNGLDNQNIIVNKAQSAEPAPEEPTGPDFQIKMIDLKCKFGDANLIKYKDKNIVIDAGGESVSADEIYNSIKDLTFIDYMIFTHADSDHIYNFADRPTAPFERWFALSPNNKIGTIIDFDFPEMEQIYKEKDKFGNIRIKPNYVEYKKYKNKLKSTGRLTNFINAKEAVNGGNKGFFSLDKDKPENGFRILDNYFYTNNVESLDLSARRNNVSVCTLFEIDGYKHLFTGDLEEYESQTKINDTENEGYGKPYKRIYGESFLVSLNYDYLKDGVVFYKAGHHGSYTSNSPVLMDLIRPRYIGISASLSKFDTNISPLFPGQISLNNMAKWTDYIYTTDYYVSEGEDGNKPVIAPYYGDIIFNYYSTKENNDKFEFTSSEIQNKSPLEKSGLIDDQLLNSRYVNMNIYTLGGENNGFGVYFYLNDIPYIDINSSFDECVNVIKNGFEDYSTSVNNAIYKSSATYIKFGHIDILINFGSYSNIVSQENIKKVNKLCNDNVLEYLILSNNNVDCYSDLVGNKGLLNNTSIYKIENLFYFGDVILRDGSANKKNINSIINSDIIKVSKTNIKNSDDLNNKKVTILKNSDNFELYFQFLNMPRTQSNSPRGAQVDYRLYNLMFYVNITNKFKSSKASTKFSYLNLGNLFNKELALEIQNTNKLQFCDVYDLLSNGYVDDKKGFAILNILYRKIGSPLFLFNGMMKCNKSYPCIDEGGNNYNLNKVFSTSITDYNDPGNKNKILGGNVVTRVLMGPYVAKDGKTILYNARTLIYGSKDVDYTSSAVTNNIKLTLNNYIKIKTGLCYNLYR